MPAPACGNLTIRARRIDGRRTLTPRRPRTDARPPPSRPWPSRPDQHPQRAGARSPRPGLRADGPQACQRQHRRPRYPNRNRPVRRQGRRAKRQGRADGECRRRHHRRLYRRGGRDLGHAQFVAQVAAKGVVFGKAQRYLPGQPEVQPALDIDRGQLVKFPGGVGVQFGRRRGRCRPVRYPTES